MGELVQIIQLAISLATLATLVWGLVRMFQGAIESRAARTELLTATLRTEDATKGVAENIQKIELATNSMKDALVIATAESSRLGGREEMRVEQATREENKA